MNLTPRSIFLGKNSDGSNFRIAEWDFATLSNIEFTGLMVRLVVLLALSSIVSPILVLIGFLWFNGRFKVGYLIAILTSIFFLTDCYYGWLTTTILSTFCDDAVFNILIGLNIMSLIISTILFLFSGAIYSLIADPIDDEDYEHLSEEEQKQINDNVEGKKLLFVIILLFICSLLFFVGTNTTIKHHGWLNTKTSSVEKTDNRIMEQKRREVGDFKTKQDRDKHFDDLQRKWGN